ncbi:FAD/NAD(P)-binding protein [Galbibacter mesophilus]|uniref:FAD/NAD(P)-binding protein n=1 Tax=Galbibacter mesophilus TaxID=379069 RepID=UPI00191F5760|nr:FAD/NAD(P)-binding domain-containing protein [Galbibacter mesophilus]MCM5662411.1 FAD/NAD(P)-binding protein [Galbibacter mesophilus]
MKKIAIVGVGPRGLSALESLLVSISNQQKEVEITLFDNAEHLGAGEVWRLNQPDVNWLNISERDLETLDGRKEFLYRNTTIPHFPSYREWANTNHKSNKPDFFPPRNKIGRYFKERFETLSAPLLKNGLLELISTEISRIDKEGDRFHLEDTKQHHYFFNEVLLTIGHQPTENSEELNEWMDHAKGNKAVLLAEKPYPVESFLASEVIDGSSQVALRGFGLAMIDVMRALTLEKGGRFEIVNEETLEGVYHPSEESPKKIIPFSLDGKPPIPKPLTKKLDEQFKPSKAQLQTFSSALTEITFGNAAVDNIDFFKEAVAEVASGVYIKNLLPKEQSYSSEEIRKVILAWLDDEDYSHPLLYDAENNTKKSIQDYLKMATGKGEISLDYCVGQVWRHCHYPIFDAFSYTNLEEDILVKAFKLHGRMKRYSFGPPVESMQQLWALIQAKVVTLHFVDNPDISTIPEGWKLKKESKTITVSTLINCVLDAPQLLKVTSPLVKNLLCNELIAPVHTKLGIATTEEASVLTPENGVIPPLSVLGRLAKGSVLGVDSISACFGERVQQWADATARRM